MAYAHRILVIFSFKIREDIQKFISICIQSASLAISIFFSYTLYVEGV